MPYANLSNADVKKKVRQTDRQMMDRILLLFITSRRNKIIYLLPLPLVPQVIEGYRLSQPHSCPDEFYAIMMSCWTSPATDRPQFSVIITSILDPLENKLDSLLSQEGKATRPLPPPPVEELLPSRGADKKWISKKAVKVREQNYFSVASKVALARPPCH